MTPEAIHKVMRNILDLLQSDPRNYRKFGVYWWPIKALLRHYYTRHNLYMLGTYEDAETAALVPTLGLEQMLRAAFEDYASNARLNLDSNQVEAPNGETVTLCDADAGF